MPWEDLVRTPCTVARAQVLNHLLLHVEGLPPDDPPAPPFNGSSVNSLDEVEMTTFRSETTGGRSSI